MIFRDRSTAREVFLLAAVVCSATSFGCSTRDAGPMVVATTWPTEVLAEVEATYRRSSGDSGPIEWVVLVPGERLEVVLGRRHGVDVLLGGPLREFASLGDLGKLARVEPTDHAPWRLIRRPRPLVDPTRASSTRPREYADPRDDPGTLAIARATLGADGWAKGYESLVRRASVARPTSRSSGVETSALGPQVEVLEGLACLSTSKQAGRSRRFLKWLAETAVVEPSKLDASESARADGLLADLLGSALVDAHDDLRDAQAALDRHAHPIKAESAIGEAPPWPPASVTRLMAKPGDSSMVDALLEQVAPDLESRDWLRASWSKPKRPIDGALLVEIARAVDGKLAREPRFRGWLRGEWTAWTRQLYRRVARVAGGYTPS